MPYAQPPEKIKALPAHAQAIWVKAFNAAYEQYGGDEAKAHAVAWAAVERAGYKKNADGQWIKTEESQMENQSLDEQRREDVSKADVARAEKEYGDVEYADPENKKYPIDKEHVHAAWNYINKPKNAAKYSKEKLAKMKARIIRAFKKYTGHEPPSVAEAESVSAGPDESYLSELFDAMADEMDDEPGCPQCGGQLKDGVCIECRYAKPKEARRTMVFGELVPLREAVVDPEHKTVEVTLIQPGWSANGRYYSRDVLAKAVPVFEGTRAFADHPSLDEDRGLPERSVLGITGYYTNVRQGEDGSLKATRHFVGKRGEEIFPLVLEAIQRKPDLIGLSINAMGRTTIGEVDGRTGVIVEELVKAFSVDDVTIPSAGGKYDRLLQSGNEMTRALLEQMTYAEWRAARPEFVARMRNEMRTARKEELEAAALREAAELKTQLNDKDLAIQGLRETIQGLEQKLTNQEREYANRVNELTADLKLMGSRLPQEWCESLKPQLLARPHEMDALIEVERKKFFSNKEPIPVHHAGLPRPEETEVRDPKLSAVLEALGVDPGAPLDAENVNEYIARKRQRR